MNELTWDKLATASGATVASIGYGYDPNGNLTSKTTTGFAGATTNNYTYDEANRLTSWNNGATTTDYGYDGAGNLTKDGSKTYTYDARDELTSDGTNTYSYTANGDLASETTPTGTVTSTTDAYGQQVSMGSESFRTDALGRTVSVSGSAQASASLSYVGDSGLVSSDGTSTYSWDPSGNLTGVGQVGAGTSAGVLAWTDAHTDVVGDFTVTGSSLAGSTSYDPWGMVTAVSGTPAGRLGYQSQYTDPSSGQVDMGSRWYSPARGGFEDADTANVDPVPDGAAANPFAYAGDNPLDGIDPTGHSTMMLCADGTCGSVANMRATHPCGSACESHPPQPVSVASYISPVRLHFKVVKPKAKSCSWLSLGCDLKRARHAVAHAFDKARHDVAATTDDAIHAVAGATTDIYADVIRPGMVLALRVGRDTLNAVQDAAVYGLHAAGTVISYAAQAGSRAYHAVTRAATTVGRAVVHAVKSTWHAVTKAATATVSFVKHHAAVITSIVVGVAVFAGCEAATLGVGTVGCAALAGAAAGMASYAVTAAQAGRFSVTGLLMAGVTGALTGALTAGLLEGASGLAGGLLSSGAEDGAASMADGAVAEAADATTESAAGTADATGQSTADDTAARSGDDDQSSSCTVGGQSFTAGTKVLLASGVAVPISQLKAGEKVLATDTKTGKTQAETVTAVLVHHDTDLYDLTIKAGGRTAVIDTTRSHLFWDPTSRRWIKAAALKHGTHLRTPSGTDATVIGGHAPRHTSGWMWDLTITPSHDFYIDTTAADILVHNSCGPAEDPVNWVDEGGDLRAGKSAGMRSDAYDYQSGVSGARSNAVTGRPMAPQLEMPALDGSTVTAKFDGIDGNEIIDRKLNPMFTVGAVDLARRQAATAAYNGFQAVWELPTEEAVAAANRFMDYAGISTIVVRMAP